MFYKSKDFVVGLKVELNGDPYIILESIFVNPGKGQAFNKLKLKNLLNKSILVKTIKIGEKLKVADILYKDLKYLYSSDNIFYFLGSTSDDFYEIPLDIIDKFSFFLKIGNIYSVVFWNDTVFDIKIPRYIDLKIIAFDNFSKNICLTKNLKLAKLETGLKLKVPTFIKEFDIIKVDTLINTFVSRVSSV